MQMFWERPLRCSDELSSLLMLVNGVFGVQQTLSRFNVNVNIDPILRGAVAQFTDAADQEPFVYKVESFL
jgi:hypothetical protein